MTTKKKPKKTTATKANIVVKKKAITKKIVSSKKKSNAPIKKRAKVVIGKKKIAGKRIVIGKTVVVTKKKEKAKKVAKKIAVKTKTKKAAAKRPVTPVITHGPDLHLIPVAGEILPARIEETHRLEKNYKHNEETALHFEQQRIKQIMGMTRGGGKRIFKNRGQR